MSIIMRVGGGGNAVLRYTATAYSNIASIPAIGSLVDFAIITTTAIPATASGGIIASYATPTNRAGGAALQSGDLWFFEDFPTPVSNVPFCPRAVFQYISSAWVEKPCMVWTGLSWTYLALLLYRLGNEYKEITGTGGWVGIDSFAKNGADLLFTTSSSISGAFVTYSQIDLTPYSKIKAYSMRSSGAPVVGGKVIVTTSKATIAAAIAARIATGNLELSNSVPAITELDVTACNGTYYIMFVSDYTLSGNQNAGSYVYQAWLE